MKSWYPYSQARAGFTRPVAERALFLACGFALLALIATPLGWWICDIKEHALAAAGASFQVADGASDSLFLGILISAVAIVGLMISLIVWAGTRGRQPFA